MQNGTESLHQTSSGRGRRKTVLILEGGGEKIEARCLRPETKGFMDYGTRRGWDMVDLYHWGMKIPKGIHPDGLIASHTHSYQRFVDEWYPQVPVGVVLEAQGKVSGPWPYPIVRADRSMIGRKAADYFLERRFENCGVCHYGSPVRSLALTEFEERMREVGGTCASIRCSGVGPEKFTAQANAVKQQVSELRLPLAIFCMNDRLALRTCRWCLEMGLAIPEQVAILGQGNDLMTCLYSPVPLSSFNLAPEERGRQAARLLQQMMDGAPAPTEPVLVPVGEIITRRSTDILAVPDRDVARALRYIWDHYHENVGVDDIATACDVSRSKLDHHFRNELGRTVNQELTRKRLEKACELLTTSDQPIIDIAAMAGYRSPQYFNNRFKQVFNITPEQCRRQNRSNRRQSGVESTTM